VKRKIFLLLLTGLLISPWSGVFTPQARAFEPITMTLLAPVALKVYEKAEPRLIRGAKTGGKKLIEMGVDTFEILYLPWGAIQATAGIPLGGLRPGIKNMGKGIIAPGKLVLDTLAFPFCLMGVDL